MQIYDAYQGKLVLSTPSTVGSHSSLKSRQHCGSVAQLQSELAQLTDIASEFQVLITSDGEYIRCDDQNERCFRKNIDLFLFDRRIMKVESLEADEAISPLGPLANIPSEVVLTYANLLSQASAEHFEKSCEIIRQTRVFLSALESLSLFFHKFKASLLDKHSALLKTFNELLGKLDDSLRPYESSMELMRSIPVSVEISSEKKYDNLLDFFDINTLSNAYNTLSAKKEIITTSLKSLHEKFSSLDLTLKRDTIDIFRLGLEDRQLQIDEADKLISSIEILLSDIDEDLRERAAMSKRSLLKNNSLKELMDIETKMKNFLLDNLKARESSLAKFCSQVRLIDGMETNMRHIDDSLVSLDHLYTNPSSQENINASITTHSPILITFNQFPQNYFIGLLEILRRKIFSKYFQAKMSFFVTNAPLRLIDTERKQRHRFQQILSSFPKTFLDSLRDDHPIEFDPQSFSISLPRSYPHLSFQQLHEYYSFLSRLSPSNVETGAQVKKLLATFDKIFGYFERMSVDMNNILSRTLGTMPEVIPHEVDVFDSREPLVSPKSSTKQSNVSQLSRAYYEDKIKSLEHMLEKSFINTEIIPTIEEHESQITMPVSIPNKVTVGQLPSSSLDVVDKYTAATSQPHSNMPASLETPKTGVSSLDEPAIITPSFLPSKPSTSEFVKSVESISMIAQLQERNNLLESQNKELRCIIEGLSDNLANMKRSSMHLECLASTSASKRVSSKISLFDWKNIKESWKRRTHSAIDQHEAMLSFAQDLLISENIEATFALHNLPPSVPSSLKDLHSSLLDRLSYRNFDVGSKALFLLTPESSVYMAFTIEKDTFIFLSALQVSRLELATFEPNSYVIGIITEFKKDLDPVVYKAVIDRTKGNYRTAEISVIVKKP